MTFTDPAAEYAPATVKYLVPVVVHVIQDAPGTSAQGYMTPANVQGQIDILNEDFLAIPGSPGASGNDAQLEFFLANTTPAGLPTTGIDYIVDAQAFNDAGAYWQQYSWDPNNYLNIYTLEIPIDPNEPTITLGYVPNFPANGSFAGSIQDRIVIRWTVFGPDAPDAGNGLGRTLTHEVGHYLGLFHTFQGCSPDTAPGCHTGGDLICDTPAEDAFPEFGCAGTTRCNGPGLNDRSNYMSYSDDSCVDHFTPEQVRRARCTLESYRSQLYLIANPNAGACCSIDQSCTVKTATDCVASGGTFRGLGVTCTGSLCSPEAEGADACVDALVITTSFIDTATTSGMTNDISTLGTCGTLFGNNSAFGRDLAYRFRSPATVTINATLTPLTQKDLSLYVLRDCGDPTNTCVAGDDDDGAGVQESISFLALADETYFIIVDGFGITNNAGDAGDFRLQVSASGAPDGACCMESGACAAGTEGACLSVAGVYQGDGVDCDDVDCPQPPPTGACCNGLGICSVVSENTCDSVLGTYQGDFVPCTPNPCPDPFGICCTGGGACTERFRTDCDALGGSFGGNGTTCTSPNCADIPGACCLDDGACGFISAENCTDQGGLFKGFGLPCNLAACPQPTGACCVEGAPCSLMNLAACEGGGGIYQGHATSCASHPCPQSVTTTAPCCHTDASCEILTESDCADAGGISHTEVTTCSSGLCPEATGACCFGGGACSLIAQSACEDATGTFAGEGTACPGACNDACLDDPDKTAPGECGCGVPDVDSDGDGALDCDDECASDPNKIDPGNCGCGQPETCPPPCVDGGLCGPACPTISAPMLLAGLGLMRRRRRF